MAKQTSKNNRQTLMSKLWVRALIALAFIGLAYGFASLAIDSGNLLEYLITLVLLWWAVKHAVRAVRLAFS